MLIDLISHCVNTGDDCSFGNTPLSEGTCSQSRPTWILIQLQEAAQGFGANDHWGQAWLWAR